MRRDSVKNNTHERYYYFADERSDSGIHSSSDDTGKPHLSWRDFNCNFHSSIKPLKLIEEICQNNLEKEIDLRPYMIEKPYFVYESDRIQKIVEVFRLMNLRHLPVLSEADNTVVGIITRQDIFAYMSL